MRLRLYGSTLNLSSRREAWDLRACYPGARKVIAKQNRVRARRDAKLLIDEAFVPSEEPEVVSHESYSAYVQANEYSFSDYFDDDYSFEYCDSERCFCCAQDLDGTQYYSCVSDRVATNVRKEREAAQIARIEEALSNPIRKESMQEVVGRLTA